MKKLKPRRFTGLGRQSFRLGGRSTFRPKFRLGGRPLFRFGKHPLGRAGGWLFAFLLRSQIITVFLGLCVLGIIVGVQTRPAPGTFPYAELFDQLQVMSYRDAPTDTSSQFVVQLCAGGKVFSQYDIEGQVFQPPPSGRSYARTITGTHYGPLRVRGHVGYGFWLDVPSRRTMLPEQYEELYRRTLDLMKPVQRISGAVGVLSGYSIGYRLGTWNGSLSSHAVQQRVLATHDLGRMIAREAWRRVLLEPMVMTGEEDASRFAAVTGSHQLYANFFRLALHDSDGFIPREAARLVQLGHAQEARAMLAFAEAAQRAALDSVHVTNEDFEAVERWATLLDRRGHWIQGAVPPPGEERIKLMGTLAWYGLAPPSQNVDRVWVGPRMLVRVGDAEGFVADEIPATGAGCPISWRPRLREENSGTSAMVGAWLADRPEFTALAEFGRRFAHGLRKAQQQLAAAARSRNATASAPPTASPGVDAVLAHRTPTIVEQPLESRPGYDFEFKFASTGGAGSLRLIAPDSAIARSMVLAVQAVVDRNEPASPDGIGGPVGQPRGSGSRTDSTSRSTSANDARSMAGPVVDEAADTLRARGIRDALIELPGTARALGDSAGGQPWSLPLRDPRGRIPAIARLRLMGGQALGTTAGRDPAQGLLGVAVVAPDARAAARWSAVLVALDPNEARLQARQRSEIAVVLIQVGADGHEVIWVESDLKDRFVLDSQAQGLFRVESF